MAAKAKQSAKHPATLALPAQDHARPTADRTKQGKAMRKTCSREAQAVWNPPANRANPVDLLVENSRGRVEHLVPIRYGRMMASPFAFYRGAAAIMAYDLSHTANTGLMVQACGDAHLLNFGGFATPERKLIFDINDFDETSIAPWEWDVKRLVASFVVAGRANGIDAADCREAAWLAAQSYRENMALYGQMPVLEAWYDSISLDDVIENIKDKDQKRFYSKKLASATAQSAREKEFARLAHSEGYPARIIDQPPLIFHDDDINNVEYRKVVETSFARYLDSIPPERRLLLERFEMADVAVKVVGVGSVGTFCGIVLLMSGNGDPLFLQFKQARQSVLEPYAGASPYQHAGERVVHGQRLMQSASDMFLGWMTGAGKDARQFYMRQLRDAKIKPVVEVMKSSNLKGYAGLCGHVLARAHARSADVVQLSGYMGKNESFEDAMADFAVAYADQNERDHAALVAAVRAGQIEAQIVE